MIKCECGQVTGQFCDEEPEVTIEYMPRHLRARHEAAGNRGVHPHNGSLRLQVSEECADLVIEHEDGWAELVEAEAYRAAYWLSDDGQAEVRLTSPDDAGLADEDLLAEARAEAARTGTDLATGSLVVGDWTE